MKNQEIIRWVLRIAIAGEFIGHGLLAIGGKPDWIGWIQKFGIADPVLAGQILFGVGIIDVCAALVMFTKPFPAILLGAAIWAFWTALVRPLVGVGWLDFVERSANWGAPLSLLLITGWPRSFREWFFFRNNKDEMQNV